MSLARQSTTLLALAALTAGGRIQARATDGPSRPVTPPPETFFALVPERDRQAAREFYTKCIDIGGMPVVASSEVADLALERTHEIVTHLLAGRPDVLAAMVEDGMYLVIIGKDQVYTDIPEYRNRGNKEFLNERVRGTGGKPTSFGEENLLSLPVDRYDDESIGVHEFCHTIDSALRRLDPTWRERKTAVYREALEKGLYKGAYARGNPGEYWAEICQSYFDCNRVNNWNHGPVGTREQLKVYDRSGYELVRTTFNLNPEQDWRYSWLRKLPCVSAPPAKLGVDPYYTKFTWAREFTILGREAGDEALLKANDTVRKMFAYRHDILKALIADGVRLAVLGRDEGIADLPEYKDRDAEDVDLLARFLDYTPETKLLVVGEENVSADPAAPLVGSNQVIRLLARALHSVTATRPVDPEWESRSIRLRQQYELRVTRLDVRFDERLAQIYGAAMERSSWKGTAAAHDRVEYWAAGVLAYFDAMGQEAAPDDATHPIATREALAQYDPELYTLVHETMAYAGHVDWRFKP